MNTNLNVNTDQFLEDLARKLLMQLASGELRMYRREGKVISPTEYHWTVELEFREDRHFWEVTWESDSQKFDVKRMIIELADTMRTKLVKQINGWNSWEIPEDHPGIIQQGTF